MPGKTGKDMEKELLKFLTNDLVVRIFLTLCSEPMNTRGLARILGVDETIISKKLRKMEKLGLVESKWVRVKDKNIKLYYPRTSGYSINITPHGVEIRYGLEEIAFPAQARPVPSPELFIGREKELALLRDETRKFIYIVGLPGIGKSSLVSRYARESGYKVVWIDVLETTTLQGIARTLAFTVEPDDRRKFIDIMRNSYGDASVYIDLITEIILSRRILLVLDNYHLNSDPGVDTLVKNLSLLEKPVGKVIVISRSLPKFYISSEKIMRLGPLNEKDAVELLQKHGLSREAARQAYRVLGGHPYLLILFAKEYAKNPGVLRNIPKDPANYLISELLGELNYDDRSILNLLCVLRKTAPMGLLRRMDIEPRSVRKSIDKLLSNLIVIRLQSGYQIAEMIKDIYCKMIMEPEHYHGIAARYYSMSDRIEDLLESLYHYVESGEYDSSIVVLPKIASAIIENDIIIKPYLKYIEEIDRSATKDHVKAWASFILARVLLLAGKTQEALELLNWAEVVGRDHDDYRLVLYSKIEKSLAYRFQSRYDEAIRELRRAKRILDVFRPRNRGELRVKILMSLAPIYYFKGRINKAYSIFHLLQGKYLDPMDSFKRALVYGWLGLIHRLRFEIDKSIEMLGEAIKIFENLNARHSLAIAYRELALTYFSAGRLPDAENNLRKAIGLLEKMSSPKALIPLVGSYIDYAVVKALQGDSNTARNFIGKAAKFFEEKNINVPEYRALLKVAEALVAYRMKGYDKAMSIYREILPILGRFSFYRRIYIYSIYIAITCSHCRECDECSNALEEMNTLVGELVEQTFNKASMDAGIKLLIESLSK